MMRENVRKVVLSSVKVVICILFFVQSAQSETISESSKCATLSVVEVNNEMVFETREPILSDTLSTVKSIKKLKALSEKTNMLHNKVKILLERLEAILRKVKTEAPAQELDPVHVEESSNTDVVFKYPTHVFAGGISTCKEWTGYGLQGSYAYRVNSYISMGLQGNAFFKDGKYNGDRSLYTGIRANFHILPLFVKNSNFDLYAGGTLGAEFDDDDMTFETMGYVGVSYDFCKHWGVFAEAGSIGVLGLRMNF